MFAVERMVGLRDGQVLYSEEHSEFIQRIRGCVLVETQCVYPEKRAGCALKECMACSQIRRACPEPERGVCSQRHCIFR